LWGDDIAIEGTVTNIDAIYKPFKNPQYRAPRRYRNLKQILSVEKNAVEAKQEEAWKHGQVYVPGVSCTCLFCRFLAYLTSTRFLLAWTLTNAAFARGTNKGADWSLDALPSFQPAPAKYCDLTGLVAKYRDPHSELRYNSTEVYRWIKGMTPQQTQAFLALRGAALRLK